MSTAAALARAVQKTTREDHEHHQSQASLPPRAPRPRRFATHRRRTSRVKRAHASGIGAGSSTSWPASSGSLVIIVWLAYGWARSGHVVSSQNLEIATVTRGDFVQDVAGARNCHRRSQPDALLYRARYGHLPRPCRRPGHQGRGAGAPREPRARERVRARAGHAREHGRCARAAASRAAAAAARESPADGPQPRSP